MSNESNKLISCHHHDYFEAACVKRAEVKLVLKDGSKKQGIAWDIVARNKVECLVLRVHEKLNQKARLEQAEHQIEVSLSSILSMTFIDGSEFAGKRIDLG